MNQTLTFEEKVLWIRLARAKGVGPITFWKLLRKGNDDIRNACKLANALAPEALAEKELLAHEKPNYHLLTTRDENFPKNLTQLKDCPPTLSVIGNVALLNKPSISIVGARNASLAGKIFARKIALELGQSGFVIVSGMARGIDGAAHEASIPTGSIAVLAEGADVIYPTENEQIYRDLEKRGTIVSEMPLGTKIDAALFPRRNRIIAGMSHGVVLIEAAAHSGSLITAQYALESGKEIFAVPGWPADPRARGGNLLIKQGATLVEGADDVLESMKRFIPSSKGARRILNEDACAPYEASGLHEANAPYEASAAYDAPEMTPLKESILNELTSVPVSIEALFQSQECSLPTLLSVITELEIAGAIRRHPNGNISVPS
jgi:DNA processing protein